MTHVEDVKDPSEVLPPTRNCVFVGLRMEGPGYRVSFTLVDDLPLDFGHSPAIETFMSGLLGGHITGSTYVVNCSMAWSPD